ncbi:hypothetical protein WME90_42970 [Sorangium sp. So ce375]|uniref:hypothetical protein n=1 Tax=Sorangium sp. So ce375 TaxID=3133306 RepID=UPI003F5C9664
MGTGGPEKGCGSADGVEQLQQPGDRAADVAAALGHDAEECLAAAGGACEAIETAVLAGAALLVVTEQAV